MRLFLLCIFMFCFATIVLWQMVRWWWSLPVTGMGLIAGLLGWLVYLSPPEHGSAAEQRATFWCLVVMGVGFMVAGVGFLFSAGWDQTALMDVGDAAAAARRPGSTLLALPINFFLMIGPIGNALIWGTLGLFALWNLWSKRWIRVYRRQLGIE